MANRDKISACFLCLRNVEKDKTGHDSNGHGKVDHPNCDSGDILLLKRFLSLSLDLPPAVIGDLLCTNVGTGEGKHQGHGENLLCGSCKVEMGAACQIFQELTKKLMELEEILENSVKKVSDKLKANLHQKVGKQLNHSRGSTKEGGRRVQRLRDLLALKLATAKTKCIEDEVEVTGGNTVNTPGISGSGTSENKIEDFQGVHHENRKQNEPETETVAPIVKVESDQGEDDKSEAGAVNETVEENEGMDLGVAKDNGGHRHCNGGSNSTSTPAAVKCKESRGLVVVERPFTCLKCSESFRDMDSVQRHQRLCKPTMTMESSSSGHGKPTPTSTTSGKAKMKPVEPGNRNERLLREDIDIDVNMEERSNSSAAAEAEDDADDDIPIQCLRCSDRFKTIQGFKKHQEWCKPLKVQHLKMKAGPAKKKLGRGRPYSGPVRKSKDSNPPKTIQCRFCCKTFCTSTRFNHLERHERIHTGVKPFQCPYCKKRFNQKSNCKTHLTSCKVRRTRPEIKNGNEFSEAAPLEVVTVTGTSGESRKRGNEPGARPSNELMK